MSPAVTERKLAMLNTYHTDLVVYNEAGVQEKDHYAIERLIQLCVEVMFDISVHWLTAQGFVQPDNYSEVFREVGRRGLLPESLSQSLTNAIKMRNLIVHAYEKIDWLRVQEAMPVILRDVSDFISEVTTRLLKKDRQRP
ncbi:MAG: HepT-like ribonuclease domain-containing protein [Planctomycetota bacterium]|nr:HepT-like ribonuclease domain-containing protein [Planctomycetota bacterium]